MASRVLLISSNRCEQPYPVFPLGVACVETALRQAGHVTRLYDCHAETEPLATVVTSFQPDFVGVSLRNVDDIQPACRQTFFESAAALCREVRELCHCPVVLGGSAFSIFPQQLLELTGADFGIEGEGEVAFTRLIAALVDDASITKVPGLVYRQNGRILHNPREPISPGSIAPTDRAPELVAHYLRRSSMLNIQTQRGCHLKCCYCTYPLIDGRRCRRRSPDAVAAEMETMRRQGAKHVFITDSVFNTSAEHVTDICEAILRQNVEMRWSCFLRPKNITEPLMNLMARAGLSHIEFGADSFCDSVLEEYGKAFTFDDILQSSELAEKAGVHYSHFLICGGPGETRETLQTTFANSRRLRGAVIFALAGMRVYPGTPLLARAEREGVVSANADLLRPVYYISPALPENELLQQLAEFQKEAPHWMIGAVPSFFADLANRLRQRGVVGPLWEYYPRLQRLT
jgi:radical SAM superfamily enzyme YgiQ (UPF0313 family)